ncbi:MAG: HAMP domain-containing sensor histidine kinase [Proteobacteria bacterium]|nr:HAMP domain-containing sensor histidine kinase [Pseudomonadota bacterium]
MFKLQRYFSLASAAAIILLTVALSLLYRQNAVVNLSKLIEAQNVALAQSFANNIWPVYTDYVNSVAEIDGDALRAQPETQKIHVTLKALTAGLPVLKVKMYRMDGLTVYSSEFSQIGSSKEGQEGFEKVLRNGKPSTKSSFRETFWSFDGQVENRHLIETYLPIYGPGGRVEGVFELYSDVTPQIVDIGETTATVVIYLLLGLGLLYGVLFLIVRSADRILKRQYNDLEHEIAERKQAEEDRRLALVDAEQANQAKSEFLATMSHDLRTPLNAILGFSDFIRNQYFGPVGDKYQEYAEDIHSSGELLLSLVNDILDLSAIEAGKRPLAKENFSISDIVTECEVILKEQAQSLGIDLVMKVSKDTPPLYADRRAITQILLNMLSNSVKFTPEGGKVTLRATATNTYHTIEVSDTGKGIPADKIETITDPFVRGVSDPHKSHQGTGLGLSIVKSLVDLHDGELDIKSTVAKGTTVTVTLPIQRDLHLSL